MSHFDAIKWLEPDENPFHVRVLDCRPFTTTMMSSTQDQNIAARYVHLRSATGDEHRGKHPADVVTIDCMLRYAFNGESRDGPLFMARQMEDKWDIFLYDGELYFARSWTGNLVFKAGIQFKPGQAVITSLEEDRNAVGSDRTFGVRAVDFLVKSHLLRLEAPHPLPVDMAQDVQPLVLLSFSQFGRWAHFGTFEDTTKLNTPKNG